MFDPSKVLSRISKNITSQAQPPRPQLPSLFDYFLKTCSEDLIHPAVIKKWIESHGSLHMTPTNHESSFPDRGYHSIPVSFFDQVAVEVFNSLSDAAQLEIQEANERAYYDAVIEYKDEMKKLYRGEGIDRGEYGALEMTACVLEQVMAALEAITDLHMIGWAGGCTSTSDGIGIIKISSQCSGPTEPPMIFPRSRKDVIRQAAQKWMAEVGEQVIEQWVGTDPYTPTKQVITKTVEKRKNSGDDIRLTKKTKTTNNSNIATRQSAAASSLSLYSISEKNGCSTNTALRAYPSEGQMTGSQNSVVRRAPLLASFAVSTPPQTPLRYVLAPPELNGRQSQHTYLRHRSESLPPIRTLDSDEGSAAYRPQVTWSAFEDLRLLIRNREQKRDDTAEEYQKHYSYLIATLPSSARNLRYGLETIIKVDLGSTFRDIVMLLIENELLHGFKSPINGLPTRLRPYEVTKWIRCGRGRAGGKVTVVNIERFSKAWWKWWMDMQPKWRERGARGKPKQVIPVRAEEEEWTCLHKPGANGMLGVVAGLHGWGAAIKNRAVLLGFSEQNADWLFAVKDCHWVMERLIKTLKRKQEEGSDGHRSEEDELDVETVGGDID